MKGVSSSKVDLCRMYYNIISYHSDSGNLPVFSSVVSLFTLSYSSSGFFSSIKASIFLIYCISLCTSIPNGRINQTAVSVNVNLRQHFRNEKTKKN